MKRHHDQGNSYENKLLCDLAYSFIYLVHYHHGGNGGKHGIVQANVMLLETRILHLDSKAARKRFWIILARLEHIYKTLKLHVHNDTL